MDAGRVVSGLAAPDLRGGVSEQVVLVCIPKPNGFARCWLALRFAFRAVAPWRRALDFSVPGLALTARRWFQFSVCRFVNRRLVRSVVGSMAESDIGWRSVNSTSFLPRPRPPCFGARTVHCTTLSAAHHSSKACAGQMRALACGPRLVWSLAGAKLRYRSCRL